ncbi:reverse transcriptase domain-containing protein [Tanacetum coccineum]
MVNIVEEPCTTWMDPIINYLEDGHLPEDPITTRKIRIKAPQYSLKQGILYRKGYLTFWMPCVGPNQARYVLQEAHFGSHGLHVGPRTIAQKVARLGYYCPTMYNDATKVISACVNYQEHAPIMRKPQCDMVSISSPWPFYQWGIDLVGVIISDNGKQFSENPFRNWCDELSIKQQFTSIAHPQANGQTEVTNRTLIQGLKTRLVYGSEAILPPEDGLPTYRVYSYDEHQNTQDLRLNLDLLEERRYLAALREARYKQHMEQYYNYKVHHTHLKVEGFVLRKNEASRQEGQRKLDPNWEGPYQIIEAKLPYTYVLKDFDNIRFTLIAQDPEAW